MATVELTIAGRKHELACRDGEEPQLRMLAALVDTKARSIAGSMGGMSEARQMLYVALLLADELNDARATLAAPAAIDPAFAMSVEHLAERLEALAAALPLPAPDGDGGVESPAADA